MFEAQFWKLLRNSEAQPKFTLIPIFTAKLNNSNLHPEIRTFLVIFGPFSGPCRAKRSASGPSPPKSGLFGNPE